MLTRPFHTHTNSYTHTRTHAHTHKHIYKHNYIHALKKSAQIGKQEEEKNSDRGLHAPR